MNTKLQGAFVFVYKKTNLLMLSFSSSFNVLLEGGRIEFEVYEKELSRWIQFAILSLDASDDELGAAVKNAAEYVIS
jgi:hypothetical protein